jgi:hypothetical protein
VATKKPATKKPAAQKTKPTRVYLEVGQKKVFAMALDWPGWGRSGKTAEDALAALADYAKRYAKVVRKAKLDFPADAGENFRVVEEVTGNKTTDFGAPAAIASKDTDAVSEKEADRVAALVRAAWEYLDATAAKSPSELRKGPRGGGRDRDKMLDHVIGTEPAYARKIGVKVKAPKFDDTEAIAAMRKDILEVVGSRSKAGIPVPKGWPIRYAARRIAWHALDHAWEMEDRRT